MGREGEVAGKSLKEREWRQSQEVTEKEYATGTKAGSATKTTLLFPGR